MAEKGIDSEILMSKMMGILESQLSKMTGVIATSPPETKEKDIVEYENRIRINGLEKFQAPSYISAINYYLNEADAKRAGKAKGALILYVDVENSGKIYKALALPFPDDEDDASMMNCNGMLCKIIGDAFKNELVNMGYADLFMSAPDNYRSSIVDGVEFSLDQKKMLEFSFFYLKRKSIVVELSLAGIPMKR